MTFASVRHDQITIRLAELDGMRGVLNRAADRLAHGWVQDEWRDGDRMCLVGSIRAESGGQLRERSIDLVWHALHDDQDGVRRVAPPQVRLARVRDLTRWNDRPGRCVADVAELLRTADDLAVGEMGRLRAELGLSAAHAGSPTRRAAGSPASPS